MELGDNSLDIRGSISRSNVGDINDAKLMTIKYRYRVVERHDGFYIQFKTRNFFVGDYWGHWDGPIEDKDEALNKADRLREKNKKESWERVVS